MLEHGEYFALRTLYRLCKDSMPREDLYRLIDSLQEDIETILINNTTYTSSNNYVTQTDERRIIIMGLYETMNSVIDEIYTFTQEHNITKEDVPMMECLSEMAREQGATPMQEIGLTLATTAVLKNEELCNALFQCYTNRLLHTIGGIINGTKK